MDAGRTTFQIVSSGPNFKGLVMTNNNNQTTKNEADLYFAVATCPSREMSAQIPGRTLLLGIYRITTIRVKGRSTPRGEIVFAWGGSFFKKTLSGVVRDCPPYSTVAVVKRNSEANSEYDVLGAGRFAGESVIQSLKWTDFKESDRYSLLPFLKSGVTKITLKKPKHLLFSTWAKRNFFVSGDDVVAYISSRDCDSGNGELSEISIEKLIGIGDFNREIKPLLRELSFFGLQMGVSPQERRADIEQALKSADAIPLDSELTKKDFYSFAESFSLAKEESASTFTYLLARCLYECLKNSFMVDKDSNFPLPKIYESIHEQFPKEAAFDTLDKVKSLLDSNHQLFTPFPPTFADERYGLSEPAINYAKAHFWEKAVSAEAFSAIISNVENTPNGNDSKSESSSILESPSRFDSSREAHPIDRISSTNDDDGKPNEPKNKSQEATMTEEEKAIVSFWDALTTAGWNYSLRDIVRFHTSVKTGALTILAGASGTGKSSLFKLYSRFATGTNEFSQEQEEKGLWKRVNVVSTWMEPSDLLGWNNPMAKEGEEPFQKAPGGLFDFLDGLQSQDEKEGKISLLCLEEMNLAQAELYFSDFLQAISDPPEERKITNPKGEDFKIPGLRIVGTCNLDHTTKPFTERFLDRCNYIDLSSTGKEKSIEEFFPKKLPDTVPSLTPPSTVLYLREEISDQAINQVSEVLQESKWKELISVIGELEILPSARVRNSMLEYIVKRPALKDAGVNSSAPRRFDIEESENIKLGLDEAFVQRVLPKLLLRGEWDKDVFFVKQIAKLSGLFDANGLDFPLSKAFLGNHLTNGSRS